MIWLKWAFVGLGALLFFAGVGCGIISFVKKKSLLWKSLSIAGIVLGLVIALVPPSSCGRAASR